MLLAADPFSVIGDQLVVSEKADQTMQKQTVSFIIQRALSLAVSLCLCLPAFLLKAISFAMLLAAGVL